MAKEFSARQTALLLLWDALGPAQVIETLRAHATARDPTIIEEIAREAEGCHRRGQAGAAEQLTRVAESLRTIHARIDMLAEVHTLGDLVRFYESALCCWLPGFSDLAEAMARDFRAKDENGRAEGIERGLRVKAHLDGLLARLDALMQDTGNAHDHLRNSPELCSPDFHTFLLAKANVTARFDHEHGGYWRQITHNLKEACRWLAAQDQHGNCPLTYDEAIQWYLLDRNLAKACSESVEEVARGMCDALEAAERLVARFECRDNPPTRVIVLSTFFEHALRSLEPTEVAALTWAARLVLDIPADYHDPRLFPTHVLHYAMGLVERWQILPHPQPVLRDCAQLLASVLRSVDPEKSPRLRRDLHLHRAQILDNLGTWSVHYLEDAVREYRAGLAVAGVRHEHVPRGAALQNLANTLWKLWRSVGNVDEHEIEQLYEDALSHLDPENQPIHHANVLANLAIFWNERPSGDGARNQEEALKRINAAISLVESVSANSLRTPARLRYLQCSFERTRGNILVSRMYGNPADNLRAAIAAYDKALSVVWSNDVESLWLRGMVQLNRGHAYLDLYPGDREAASSSLQSAYYAFDEASNLLQSDPAAQADAFMGRAIATAAASSDPENYAHALDDAEHAVTLLESTGGVTAAAIARFAYAVILKTAGDEHEVARVRELFERALEGYERRSDLAMAVRSALGAARASWHLFAAGGMDEDAARAESLLKRAAEAVENLWSDSKSSEHRFEISDLVVQVYSDLLWVHTQRGGSIVEAWRLAARAKYPALLLQLDMLDHEKIIGGPDYSDLVQQLRLSRNRLEIEKWRLQRDTLSPEVSLAENLEALDGEQQKVNSIQRMVERTPPIGREIANHVERLLDQDKDLIILDLTVGTLGTTALVASHTVSTEIRHLPLTWPELWKEVRAWVISYEAYRTTPRGPQHGLKYDAWKQATDVLLEYLGTNLVAPALNAVGPARLQGATIAFNSGSLFRLPLHAAPIAPPDNAPLCDIVDSFMYVPSLFAIPRAGDWMRPRRALCILADTAHAKEDVLREAPGEIRDVTGTLCDAGVAVTVLATRGADCGKKAFDEAGVSLAANVIISSERPTPKLVLSLLPEQEHVFYTGHGSSSDVPSLILCNDDGAALQLTALDVFSSGLVSGKDFYLSACETAHDRFFSSAEPMSFSAFLLRMGARSVVATAWVAEEQCASILAKQFYLELVGNDWDVVKAFARALRCLRKNQSYAAVRWATFMPFVGVRPAPI